MRIEFKAYGGTGSLLGRCFLALLALNACDKANASADKCVIYQLDYDDEPPETDAHNDATYFKDVCIANYIKLHNRGLNFLAPIALERSTLTLKGVREKAYPDERIFSLNSLFCTGNHQAEIAELLSSSFTTGSNSSEMQISNANGCYGDLAVNGFISERIIETNAFAKMGAYTDLVANPNDAVVFYAGSTDGGTANTMIDKDIRSLLHHLKASGVVVDHSRKFRLYGLRTTPYSKFELTGSQLDVAITSSILRDKFEMSKGVLENIASQNDRAARSQNAGDVDSYSYYNLNDGSSNTNCTEYWLDGLFLAGSQTLDVTAWQAKKDNQFHPTHFTELALAMQAMDAIANRLPANDGPCVYGYNDGGNNDGRREPVTLQSFFGNANVSYQYEIYDSQLKYGVSSFPLDKYIRAIMLTLVAIKSRMIDDFNNTSYSQPYVQDVFNGSDPQNIPAVGPLVAAELQNFLNEAKFIVMALYDAMAYSGFGGTDAPIKLMEEEIKYIYSSDTLNNPITIPSSRSLLIDEEGSQIPGYCAISLAGASTEGEVPNYVLDSMHSFNYHDGGLFAGAKKKLKGEELFLKCGGAADTATAAKIANNMIKRTFETYLALMQ
ncbi:MAG: hypothetical protein J5851_02800 [Oscillospiraceae bacterium]|nr:hypothetical protein [Oscillospiraceae bacterium]